MNSTSLHSSQIQKAKEQLDRHVRAIISWHFSPETGCPYWLKWAAQERMDPRKLIRGFGDLVEQFPHFSGEILSNLNQEMFVPKPFLSRPFNVFETGGTTGMPKQRISWEDHLIDYTEFSKTLDDNYFPKGANWLMLGPTGPRRLRLSIEHLANIRGGSCYFVDLDPRWVKKLIAKRRTDQVKAYKDHVVDQAVALLGRRKIQCLFTTPLLLQSISERVSIPEVGIKGVFCGGTTMTPQTVRFLVEEVLENRTQFVPTYGNTLMGLACSVPLTLKDNWSVTYWAPQPRAVLRVVDPLNTNQTVDDGQVGRIELTTLTREFFMPRFLERDEAIRCGPCALYPWDGVRNVRPFESTASKIVEGVY